MNKKDCFYLGKISKLHGYKGEVSLFLDVTNPEDYRSLDAFFIEIDGVLTPFFVENLKMKNKGFVAVKLQGVDSESEAQKILKKSVYLPEEILSELDDSSFYDHEIAGFKVIDDIKGEIGIVDTVIDLTSNPLLRIEFNGKEILVPIFEGLIEKVDRKKKVLFIKAPEGLIDLYIS
jgi:16S rRNA processing protein RimM